MPDKDDIRRINEQNESVPEEKETLSAASSEEQEDKKEQVVRTGDGILGRIRNIPVWVYLAFILLMILSISAILLVFHKNFRVQEIIVSGNKRFSTEQIIEMSGIEKGDHLLSHIGGSMNDRIKLRYGGVREKIAESDPYIADVSVYPKYPGQVYIEITERKKVAYVAIPDGYAIISEDSYVLDIVEGTVPEGIPEIRGLPVRSAQIGRSLDLTSSDGYDICITILGAILGADATSASETDNFDFLSHVTCIRYCDNMTTFVDLELPGILHTISVKIGSLTTISDDMNWLRYAIVEGYFDNKSGTVLDMTGKEYILR